MLYDTLIARAYTIAAMTGAADGVDRLELEALVGRDGRAIVDLMIEQHHLVETGSGRIRAGRPLRRGLQRDETELG